MTSGVQRGGERGADPEHPRQEGIQEWNYKKLNAVTMIFPIVSILIHAERI